MIPTFDTLDRAVTRAWSAVVSRGMLGTPAEVAAYMANGVAVAVVAECMATLRAQHKLPRATLLGPVRNEAQS